MTDIVSMNKTGNQENIGRHVFEVAGLGVAPFRFTGYTAKTYQACPGAPVQPGGTCDYCGAAIVNCCSVKDSQGKFFVVGPDCIAKVGDAGLLEAYKRSPEHRKQQRSQRHALEQRKADELVELLAEHAEWLRSQPHPSGFVDRKTGQPLTLADYYSWMFDACGASGKCRLLVGLKRRLTEAGL
jgi:hypothetical protein